MTALALAANAWGYTSLGPGRRADLASLTLALLSWGRVLVEIGLEWAAEAGRSRNRSLRGTKCN